MRITRWIATSFVVITTLLVSGSNAMAQERTPDFSAYPQLEHVADELTQLWVEDREAFARLDEVRRALPALSEHRRGRYVNVARLLEHLGEEALLPMLWALASDDPFSMGFDPAAWWSWRLGLVEAVGRLRDRRSAPVLMQIIEGPDPHRTTREVATSAIGRLGDNDLIEEVIALAENSPSKRLAILAGLGEARREVALNYLLQVLNEDLEIDERRAVIQSLGNWANQWAWQTSSLQPYVGEWEKGRTAIIAVLIDSYPQAEPSVRNAMEATLQLAGASLSAAHATARAGESDDESNADLWTALAERMERSPLQ